MSQGRFTSSDVEGQDVVDLLLDQHKQIKAQFARVKAATGAERANAFRDLTALLSIHEAGEEIVVHPTGRTAAGDSVVEARLREEHTAKEELVALNELGTDALEFTARFAKFEQSVLEHAQNEEENEFSALRRDVDRSKLVRMATEVKVAQAAAPTRPHPSAGESATANAMGGPVLGLFDRMRDAWTKFTESS